MPANPFSRDKRQRSKTFRRATRALPAIAFLAAAPAVFADWITDTTGFWDVGANWDGGVTPTTSLARIAGTGRNNTIGTIRNAETLTTTNGRFIFGQGGTGGSLTIVSGGSLTTEGTTIHRFGQTSAFTTTVEAGGALNIQNTSVSSDAGSTVTVAGDFNVGIDYILGNATLELIGSGGSFDVGDDLTTTASSTLDYTFDGSGIFSIDAVDQFSITSGASLIVDASAFTPGATTIALATYASLANANEFTESITAPSGYTADVVYGATSLDLVLTAVAVPEASEAAVFLLAMTGLLAGRRRQRARA